MAEVSGLASTDLKDRRKVYRASHKRRTPCRLPLATSAPVVRGRIHMVVILRRRPSSTLTISLRAVRDLLTPTVTMVFRTYRL